ncbi:hypothetical protein DYB32_001701, partial [Aphanomyces invadans]
MGFAHRHFFYFYFYYENLSLLNSVFSLCYLPLQLVMSTTTPNSVASRPILSVTNHLRGIDNFDEWHFELTTIVLQGEGLTAQATKCADVEVVWSMKGLRRALRVLDGDVKKLRAHQEEV